MAGALADYIGVHGMHVKIEPTPKVQSYQWSSIGIYVFWPRSRGDL